MTTLERLKSGEFARIVAIKEGNDIRQKFSTKGISEGSFVRIISSYGLITFEVDQKIFAIARDIAQKVRVIKLRSYS